MDVLDRLELELKTRSIGSPAGRQGPPSGASYSSSQAIRSHQVPTALARGPSSPTLADAAAERVEQKLELLAQVDFGSPSSSSSITQMSQLRLSYEREKRALELAHHAQLSQVQENARVALQRKDQACAEAMENVNQVNQGLRKACMAADERQHELTLQLQVVQRRHNEEVARLREHVASAERERDVLKAQLSSSPPPNAASAAGPTALTNDVQLMASSMADMWAERVHQLNAENERLTDELVTAKATARTALEEKAELQRQFATFRRVSEEHVAAVGAELSAARSKTSDLEGHIEQLQREVDALQKKCAGHETINELLESRLRSLIAQQSEAPINTRPAVVEESEPQPAVEAKHLPASRPLPPSRQLPKKLPPPRTPL